MRLSSRQALVMFEILKWSTRVAGMIDGIDPETRLALVNEIIHQQNSEIKELE
jgi:hypothetical protein